MSTINDKNKKKLQFAIGKTVDQVKNQQYIVTATARISDTVAES